MVHARVVAAAAFTLLVACSQDQKEACTDGEDNDFNGLTDCEDSACGPGAICGPNGIACATDRTCSACSGNGGVAEPAETSCADGVDNDCDGAIDCADPDCTGKVCDAAGNTCAGGGCGGGPGSGGSAKTIGYIRLAKAEHDVLGAFGSGYREQSLLTFEVIASDGSPYAGLPVRFSHESQGGSFIGTMATCSETAPAVCAAQGTTDAAGQVAVLLHSGRRFAALAVRAEATGAGVTRTFVAGGFTVVGAKPNGARFSVDCRPYNVPALTMTDCVYSRYMGQARDVTCTATLGDRHDNLVAVPTLVSFQSEAGLIVPAAFTPPFDPGGQSNGLGQAVGVLDVYGAPLPVDVAPKTGELSNDLDYGCGPRTANPRDGLVTVIAMVEGEEGFVDLNLNGQYDPGEPFVDIGEPFVDSNDNGIRDPGEWFDDLNGDGLYTGPNGHWDANTVLWTETRVLYTGYPAYRQDGAGYELFTRVHRGGSPPAPTPAVSPFVVFAEPPSTEVYDVFFTDAFLNPMSSFTTFGAESLSGNVTAKMSEPAHTADSLATTFRFRYCDRPVQPATCRDGPADAGCRTSPCYVQTDVGTSFLYGNPAILSITGAKKGPDVVMMSATIENVTWAFSFSGQCL